MQVPDSLNHVPHLVETATAVLLTAVAQADQGLNHICTELNPHVLYTFRHCTIIPACSTHQGSWLLQ